MYQRDLGACAGDRTSPPEAPRRLRPVAGCVDTSGNGLGRGASYRGALAFGVAELIEALHELPPLTLRPERTLLLDLPPQLGGSTYLMLADMYDSGGDIVGNQQEFEVSVDAVDLRTGGWQDGQTIATFTSTDGLFEGNLVWQAGAGVGVSVAYASTEDVAAVDLTFEEPFDGPVPLETTVTLPFVLEADKWVTRTRDPVPAGATVGVTLVDAEGGVLDAISATNASTGRVYENTATEKSGDILIDGVPLIFD